MNKYEEAFALMNAAAAVIAIDAAEKKKIKSKKKKEWVKSWRLRRDEKSSFKFLTDELRLDDKDAYRRYLRMNEDCFNKILGCIKDKIIKQNTVMRESISPEETLTLVLRFLATGETYRSLEYQTRLSLTFISITIPFVCSVIYEELKSEYLKFPNSVQEWKDIADNFNNRWQFPLCIGALDGKHIGFRASRQDGAVYHNYKGFDSIVLLALADAQYKFIYVNIGCNGRVSDGGVLNRSDFKNVLLQPQKYLPPDELIGNNRCLPYVAIGDDAFPLEKHFMKPFPYNSVEKDKKIFNFRLSHARQTVEHSFGIISNRFRVLQTTIYLRPQKVRQIVQATCVLHNFLICNSEGYMEPISPISRNINGNTKERDAVVKGSHSREAKNVRKELTEYFCQEGALPWQEQYI